VKENVRMKIARSTFGEGVGIYGEEDGVSGAAVMVLLVTEWGGD
jgi:hypothetical protein